MSFLAGLGPTSLVEKSKIIQLTPTEITARLSNLRTLQPPTTAVSSSPSTTPNFDAPSDVNAVEVPYLFNIHIFYVGLSH